MGRVLEEKCVLDRQHCLKDKCGFLDTCETMSWKMAVVLMTDNMDQCCSAWEGCQLRPKQKASVICAVLSPLPVEKIIPLSVNWWVDVEGMEVGTSHLLWLKSFWGEQNWLCFRNTTSCAGLHQINPLGRLSMAE